MEVEVEGVGTVVGEGEEGEVGVKEEEAAGAHKAEGVERGVGSKISLQSCVL